MRLVARLVALAGAIAVLIVILGYRHGIDARQPTIEIDVGASLGTERLELPHGQFPADRARRETWCRGIGHLDYLGTITTWDDYAVLSQPKWIGKPSPESSVAVSYNGRPTILV